MEAAMTDIDRIERMAAADDPMWLVPYQILPQQLAQVRHRHTTWTPELSLMTAVLDDAIGTFCRSGSAPRLRDRVLFEETAAWFESSDVDWPYAFESICDTLGLEPEWIRRGLRDWQQSRIARVDQTTKIPSVRHVAGRRSYAKPSRAHATESPRRTPARGRSREVLESKACAGGVA
jgi:hypothetical protein